MQFGKFLTMAAVPMMLLACSDDYRGVPTDSNSEIPPEQSNPDTLEPNIPDSLLKPIERDFSLIWKGAGTAEDPYQIASKNDLDMLAFYVNDSSWNFKGSFFKQTADIALSGEWKPIGIFGSNPDGYGKRPFSGIYDGASKTISGLSITDTARYSGLFGLARGAEFKNVVIKGAKMTVGSYAGVLAGMMDSVSVENCLIEGAEISGTDRVGGIVGEASFLQVSGTSVAGTVQGTSSVGGLVGRVQDGSLSNVKNNANVSGTSTVGGVVGSFASVKSEGSITSALNFGSVTGTTDVAGVVATLSNSKLEKSGNHGMVEASESTMGNVGGVVAKAQNKSTINEIYNVGLMKVAKVLAVGGVIGSAKQNIEAKNVFNHGEISGTATNMGGVVGIIDGQSKLESSYNKGAIPNENFAGTVIGSGKSTIILTNVYYDKTVGDGCKVFGGEAPFGIDSPVGVASDEMKSAAFIAKLGSADGVWTIDPATLDGYPIFAWMK